MIAEAVAREQLRGFHHGEPFDDRDLLQDHVTLDQLAERSLRCEGAHEAVLAGLAEVHRRERNGGTPGPVGRRRSLPRPRGWSRCEGQMRPAAPRFRRGPDFPRRPRERARESGSRSTTPNQPPRARTVHRVARGSRGNVSRRASFDDLPRPLGEVLLTEDLCRDGVDLLGTAPGRWAETSPCLV